MKRIALVALLALTAAIATAAAMPASAAVPPPPPANLYCLNGNTGPMPAEISFGNESRMLSQNTAEVILTSGDFPGGLFYMGYLKGTTQVVLASTNDLALLEPSPAPSLNSIARGACGKSAGPPPDRNFWLCYSPFQVDPAVYSRSEAMRLYNDGKDMKVPFAVKAPLSKTNIGNGVYLVCNLPAGYVATDQAVSTGGGEPYPAGPYSKVPAANRLDWTMLAVRSS